MDILLKQGLRHIKAFLTVAELKNFSRAAELLYLSPSTLTLQIQQLEEELGILLFNRNKREVSITPEGQHMIIPLRSVLEEYQHALSLGRTLSDQVFGELRIAVLPTIASAILPQWIKKFKQNYPRIKIIILDLNANEIQNAVKNGIADIGIGTQELSDAGLVSKRLFEDKLCLFLSRTHPLMQKRQIFLKDVAQFPQILTMKGSSVYSLVCEAFHGINLDMEQLDIACEVRYLSTAIGLVEAEVGIAILPETTPLSIHLSNVSACKIVDFPASRTLFIMHKKKISNSFLIEEFISCIQQEIFDESEENDKAFTKNSS